MANSRRSKKGLRQEPFGDLTHNAFFDFKLEAGQTIDLVFNCRAIMANEEFWDRVQNGLFSMLGGNAAVILYQIGLEYGLSVGSKAKERNHDIHEAIKFLKVYGFLAGWGRFSTSPVVLSGGELMKPVTVTVENNFFALSKHRRPGGPRCFIIAGVLAGITEGLLSEGHNCIETMCIADGAKHCEFLITRRR
jgi:predicted hydrocarbon binding protein